MTPKPSPRIATSPVISKPASVIAVIAIAPQASISRSRIRSSAARTNASSPLHANAAGSPRNRALAARPAPLLLLADEFAQLRSGDRVDALNLLPARLVR